MRLIVLAPERGLANLTAYKYASEIQDSVGYRLTNDQIFVAYPKSIDRITGLTIEPGDQIFYVDGWEEDYELLGAWNQVIKISRPTEHAYHRRVENA